MASAAVSCIGDVGRSGQMSLLLGQWERAAQRLEVSSCGRSGLGLPRKPMFLCDSRLSSSSLRKSPPVPVRVCSRSPVKIWRQKRERSAARMVNPDWPPCCASSLMARRHRIRKEVKSG